MYSWHPLDAETLQVLQNAEEPLSYFEIGQSLKRLGAQIVSRKECQDCISTMWSLFAFLQTSDEVEIVNGYFVLSGRSDLVRKPPKIRQPPATPQTPSVPGRSVSLAEPSKPGAKRPTPSASGTDAVTFSFEEKNAGQSKLFGATKTVSDESYEKRKEILRGLCEKYSLTRLHYLAPLENVPSILNCGILPKNRAPGGHTSFANDEIQSKRDVIRPDRSVDLTLHDYVPLFFAAKPPLLYGLQKRDSHPVYFLVNPVVLLEPGVVFSPVNARSTQVFYNDFRQLDQLDWEILRAEYWARGEDDDELRQNRLRRQAEAEIPNVVPLDMIVDIGVYDRPALDLVKRELRKRKLSIPVKIDRKLYYSI